MLKMILNVVLGLSSVILLLYTYYRNQPRLVGEVKMVIFNPNSPVEGKNTLFIYSMISNISVNDNTPISYEAFVLVRGKYHQLYQFYGLEDENNPDYYIVKAYDRVMFIPEIKERLLYKKLDPIKQNHKIDGYLAFAIDSFINYDDIEEVRLDFKDAFFNKYSVGYNMNSEPDLIWFLQMSNAKIYFNGEENLLDSAIKKYSSKS